MPYRIKASLGPTFRYILAITIMIIKRPRTRSPAMITTSFGSPNIKPPLEHSGLFVSNASPRKHSLREFFPPLHVSNPLFIPLDDDFSPLLDRVAVIAARAGAPPHSRQGKNNFAGAARADRHADCAEQTLDPVVLALHRRVGRAHDFHHETEDDESRRQACEGGKQQAEYCEQVRMPGEEIAGATEPGQKGHGRRSVEPGNVRTASESGMGSAGSGVMRPVEWQMHLERKMNVNRARQKRKHAEGETHNEAEEIKIRPGHRSPRTRHLPCATSRCAARAGIRDASPVNCHFETLPVDSAQFRKKAEGGG